MPESTLAAYRLSDHLGMPSSGYNHTAEHVLAPEK